MVNTSRAYKIIGRINLLNFIEIPTEGFFGWTWLCCKNNVEFKVDILKTQERFIHCQVRCNKKIFIG